MSSKPGMLKYAAQAGPYDWEPIAVRRAYWLREMKDATNWLNEAPGNKLAMKRLREASGKLTALTKAETEAVLQAA